MRAILYTHPSCAACHELRSQLVAARVDFEEVDVSRTPEVVPELLKLTRGRRLVPVLVDDAGIHVAPRGGTAF